MAQGKQAKVLTTKQEKAILGSLEANRYPLRDHVMFLLSIKAGLRAKEIAALTWSMVTDAAGAVSESLELGNQPAGGELRAMPNKGCTAKRPKHPLF
jgi:integrase/recombinase XerD